MSVQNHIWFVIKTVLLTVLLSALIVFVASVALLFASYSKIKAVGENMQAEISRNNTLYTYCYADSAGSEVALCGFGEELYKIAKNSRGAYTFKGIRIRNNDGTTKQILAVETDVDENAIITYTDDDVGAYGDFRTVELIYDISFSFLVPTGTQQGSMVEHVTTVEDVHFDFVAPCLRYLK